ncbi:MAG TPA: DUF3078 domain-containing protein [Chitinophagaceae bacterium]|nr:DUF3078 domain-containing protein [Chitinophagaceae bacterium]
MRKLICYLIFASLFIKLDAQDGTVRQMQKESAKNIKSLDSNGWKRSGTFIFNLNQGALSNWAGGGEDNTLGINSLLSYAVNFRQGKNTWDNFFDMALGFQNATSFDKYRKIDDRIDITSKYGYQVSNRWYASLLFNFNSQFLEGYDYSTTPITKISSFLSPGKIILSPGMNYKTANRFSFFISPATFRWVLKRDPDFLNVAKFGVDSAKKANMEFGAYITTTYKAQITRWAAYTGRLDLFSNYRREPQNVDLLMNNLLTMKFTKLFATNLSFDLIYDHDVRQRLQVKEIFGIGLTVAL